MASVVTYGVVVVVVHVHDVAVAAAHPVQGGHGEYFGLDVGLSRERDEYTSNVSLLLIRLVLQQLDHIIIPPFARKNFPV